MTTQAIKIGATSIARNIVIIEKILVSTDDDEVRGGLLRRLELIQHQLALAGTALEQLNPLIIDED
jgi:hypothetical protein